MLIELSSSTVALFKAIIDSYTLSIRFALLTDENIINRLLTGKQYTKIATIMGTSIYKLFYSGE
jgi:hypothetical protein